MLPQDLIQLYTRGGLEIISGISYTHYFHRAVLEHAWATGDVEFLTSQLQGLITIYNLWDVQLDNSTGLYHRTPLSDAQEYSLPGYTVGGPNGGPVEVWNSTLNNFITIWLGPETYRPNFNAYMVAGARAIATIASLTDDNATASAWNSRADTIYANMVEYLYNDDLNFWIDVIEGSNIECLGRELIGYFPWRLDVGQNSTIAAGLEAALNPTHFISSYGPTTLEQTNQYFSALKNSTYCCIWQGQSWPFSTSVYLGTLFKLALGIGTGVSSNVSTPDLFYNQLLTYTMTNYKDGQPYTAESHYPEMNMWSGDTTNHSEHYLHSTYIDNIFTNLLGIMPTLDDRLELRPLVPSNWSYFAVENLPYHGTLLSIIWDSAGTRYSGSNHSSGLSIYSNGTLIYHQSSLKPFNASLPFKSQEAASTLAAQPRYANLLTNPNAPWGLPNASADYVLSTNGDYSPYEAWKMIDNLLWYDTEPDNRWTNNQSETPYNTVYLNLPRARTFNSVSLALMQDIDRGGVIACPSAIIISLADGTTVAERNPWTDCTPNALNTVLFDNPTKDPANVTTPAAGYDITTDYLEITLWNQIHYAVAVTEIQVWVDANPGPTYYLADGLLGTFIGSFEGRKSGMNCSVANGGVYIYDGGWAEVADVRTSNSQAANGTATIVGGGTGTIAVEVNFLGNTTITFNGGFNTSQTIPVQYLSDGNYFTLFNVDGSPWVESIVVNS